MSVISLFDLRGKVAVVTGGGNGIGKACCEILSQAGAAVAVCDFNLSAAEAVADQLKAAGGKAMAVMCNVTVDEDLVNVVAHTLKTLAKFISW